MDATIRYNFADRNHIKRQVARTMETYDPELLEMLTDQEMRKHDFYGYVV